MGKTLSFGPSERLHRNKKPRFTVRTRVAILVTLANRIPLVFTVIYIPFFFCHSPHLGHFTAICKLIRSTHLTKLVPGPRIPACEGRAPIPPSLFAFPFPFPPPVLCPTSPLHLSAPPTFFNFAFFFRKLPKQQKQQNNKNNKKSQHPVCRLRQFVAFPVPTLADAQSPTIWIHPINP